MKKLNGALGVIETVGLASAITCADIAVKTANVQLLGYEFPRGDGLVAVKITGNVGAVRAAVDAACAVMKERRMLTKVLVIPRLHDEVLPMVYNLDSPQPYAEAEEKLQDSPVETPAEAEIPPALPAEPVADETVADEPAPAEKQEEATCNLCHDPLCPRKKGELHNICLHYMKN